MAVKVLLDTSVLSHAVRLRRSLEARTVTWGGKEHEWFAPVLEEKPPTDSWLQEQINASSRVAGLANSGLVELFVSAELEFELWAGPPDALWRTRLSLLEGVTLQRAPDPLQYGRVVASHADRGHDAKERWLAFLGGITDERFTELRNCLGGNKDADAFHLLTAERATLDVFLTNDKRLINAVRHSKELDTTVRVLSPTELLDDFDRAV